MKYKKPQLYSVFPLEILKAICASGNEASMMPASCSSGPEAGGGGGCDSGAAAPTRCTSGAAAGTICEPGAGYEGPTLPR